jgi:hypothetical protein
MEELMDYGEILTKAWKIIWKHKILWLFGLLASCGALNTMNSGGGGGGGASSASSQANFWQGNGTGAPLLRAVPGGAFQGLWQNLVEVPVGVWISIAILAVLTIFIFALVLSILFFFLGTLGTVGVIKGTSMADSADPNAKPLSFGKIFKALKPSYWKVFLLHIGYRVAGAIVLLMFFLPMILFMVFTCGLGLILLIPIFWFIHQMLIFTTVAIIEEKLTVFDAIERAWQLITESLGQVVLMFLILTIGQFFVGLVIGLPLFTLPFLPSIISLLVTGGEVTVAGLVISLILFLLFIPIFVVLTGIFQAYILASWTLTFRRLAQKEELSPQVLSLSSEENVESD